MKTVSVVLYGGGEMRVRGGDGSMNINDNAKKVECSFCPHDVH